MDNKGNLGATTISTAEENVTAVAMRANIALSYDTNGGNPLIFVDNPEELHLSNSAMEYMWGEDVSTIKKLHKHHFLLGQAICFLMQVAPQTQMNTQLSIRARLPIQC